MNTTDCKTKPTVDPDNTTPVTTDIVIIGGGPAGLSAGIYAVRSGLDAIILERKCLGGQIMDTTYVENYPGMKKVSGKALVEIMVSHARDYVKIYENEEAIKIIPSKTAGAPIQVLTAKNLFHTRAVLFATGAERRHLGLESEDCFAGRGISYSPTTEGENYTGKKGYIIGGGDSALTEAVFLKDLGVDISIMHRSGSLDAQDALQKSIKNHGIDVIYNSEVTDIKGDTRLREICVRNRKTGKTEWVGIDVIFVSIGYVPSVELARQLEVAITDNGYINHSSCRTSISGIYVAGDAAGGFKQIVTASSQGAEAALTIFEDLKNKKS